MSYDLASKAKAKAYVAEIRAATVCERCGNQPIEWHHYDHETNSNRRVSHLTALGFPISVIQQEIDICEALCRSCHMAEDGRAAALTANRPRKKGMILVEPLPCKACGVLAKPLRKGLCNACDHRKRRDPETKRGPGRPRITGQRPWEAAGMSRRTWYRRQKEKK